jgi:hypothetical protein
LAWRRGPAAAPSASPAGSSGASLGHSSRSRHPYDTARVVYRVCGIDGFVDWEGNRYAVPYDQVTDLVLGGKNTQSRTPRFVLGPEIGYAIATRPTLRVRPDRAEDDVLGADGSTTLARLALSGVFWRLSAGATF